MRNLSRLLGLPSLYSVSFATANVLLSSHEFLAVRRPLWEPNASPRLTVRTSECDLLNPLPVFGALKLPAGNSEAGSKLDALA